MSTHGLRVDHGGLDAASQDLHAAVARIDDRLSRLEGELAPLRSDWVGDAQQAYHAAKATWDTAVTEMRDLLGQTSRTVQQSNVEYQAADARGAAAFDI